MFEKATRIKLRFPTPWGGLSVEDLWDLPVEDLDDLFKALNADLKVSQEESLLTTASSADEKLILQVKLVRHIVEVKLAEAKAKVEAKVRAEERKRLLAILATKKAAALENLSEADIEARIAALD